MTKTNYKTNVEAVDALVAKYNELRKEIANVIVGQDEIVEQTLISILSKGHVLLVGVPGLAKTLLVNTIAKVLGLSYSRIQFTPDLMPSDIIGTEILDEQRKFKFLKGPVFANLILADEINRTPPKTQAALLEAMQEKAVTVAGTTYKLQEPFFVLATQNPIEQEGTYPLPEAQLDRFLLKVLIDYPDSTEENMLVKKVTQGQIGDSIDVNSISPVLSRQQVLEMQNITARLTVDDRVVNYAVSIVRATREWPGIAIGAGPRGSIALIRAARAQALLNGHDFVTPDDIKEITHAALRHRIVLAPEMEIEGQTADSIISAVVDSVAAPRI